MPLADLRLARLIVVFTILAALMPHLFAADPVWNVRVWPLDTSPGDDRILDLGQTRDGYLWLATKSGLSRFDGTRFDYYPVANFTKDPGDIRRVIFREQPGNFTLVLSSGKILDLHGGREPTEMPGLPKDVREAMEDGTGTLWLGSPAGLWRIKDKQSEHISTINGLRKDLDGNCSLTQDKQGQVWFAGSSCLARLHDGAFEIIQYSRELSVRACPAADGGIWFFQGLCLMRCDKQGAITTVAKLPPEERGVYPTAILEDRNGAVWIGTATRGIFRFNDSHFQQIPTSYRNITSLFEDREGNLWVGTRGEGLSRIRPRVASFETPVAAPIAQSIQSVWEDPAGVLWAAARDGTVMLRKDGEWKSFSTAAEWPGGMATCVTSDLKGNLWFGTEGYKLHCWDGQQFKTFRQKDGVDHEIRAFLVSKTGDLWMCGERKLTVIRNGSDVIETVKLPAGSAYISAIAQNPSGTIWLATEKGILLKMLEGGGFESAPLLPGKPVQALFCDTDETVWFGTNEVLGRRQKGRVSMIGREQGLFDPSISQIIADGQGWLWFGSRRGVFKVHREELDAAMDGRLPWIQCIAIGQDEGLPDVRATSTLAARAIQSRDGAIWMPMQSGIAVIYPNQIEEDRRSPLVQIRRFSAGDTVLGTDDSIFTGNRKVNALGSQPMVVSPGRHRLRWEFTALTLAAPENIHFQCRLDGIDETWVNATADRIASYSPVAPGKYTFRVRASNSSGLWSRDDAVMTFIVEPLLWQTRWFQFAGLGMIAASAGGIGRFIWLRRLQRKVRLLEQEAALEKERSRIAKDMHDDLGGTLTQAALLVDLARQDYARPEKVLDHVSKMASTIRQVTESVDEIVWAANPRNDTLADLISYICAFAVQFLETANIRCRIDRPERVPDYPLSPDARHSLFLLAKESLNNIVRHAEAVEVTLRIGISRDELQVTVADDGKGMPKELNDPFADGIGNLRQRMQEIGGSYSIESKAGEGTRVIATYPLRPNGHPQ